MAILPLHPTALQLAEAHRDRIVRPAVEQLARGGRLYRDSLDEASLDGLLEHAGDDLTRYFALTGYQSSSTNRVIDRTFDRVLSEAEAAVEADGTIHDPSRLPAELRSDFAALTIGAPSLEGITFSERVLTRVMRAYGIEDRDALLTEALRHDDGNRRLKRSELEAAAKVLTGEFGPLLDAGIISDLDKTIIPPQRTGLPENAYPGVAQLFTELEALDGDRSDTVYVTARTPRRVEGIPAWLASHGLPSGPIETGLTSIPQVAQAEKIADITRVMEANPGKRFILFGDSNHRDPEVYRAIRERFPDRVIAAFIHDVSPVTPARVEGLHLIANYAEAASILLDAGVLTVAAARRVMVRAQLEGLDITDAEIQSLLGER